MSIWALVWAGNVERIMAKPANTPLIRPDGHLLPLPEGEGTM